MALSDKKLDFVHTGPGTLAGRYLRSFWQPVFHAKELPVGRAFPIKIMGQDYVLYRGESGQPHLLDPKCAHRRANLSIGWVEQEDIRCFYHGWKFNSDGQCIEQPAEPKPFCHRVKIRSYPVREYLDLIFAYLGEGEPPELPRYPAFEDFEGIREYDTHMRACNYFNNVENFLDTTHVGFVHNSHVGGFDGRVDSPILQVEESCWGATSQQIQPSGRRGQSQFGMPNIQHVKGFTVVAPEITGNREVLGWWVPIDDEHHFRSAITAVRISKEKLPAYERIRDAIMAKRTILKNVLAEEIIAGRRFLDSVVQETTDYPQLVDDIAQISQGRIHDRSLEKLGAGDVGVIMIRNLWLRELAAFDAGLPTKAWRYDPSLSAVKIA